MDPATLNAVHRRWQELPGSAPNGTGSTGLAGSDSAGWFRQQNENMNALDTDRANEGKAPFEHQFGGEISAGGELPSTMFAPGQTSAVTGGSFVHDAPTGFSGDSTSPVLAALRKLVKGQKGVQ